jgi:pilus assembly protein CpaC
MRSILLAALLFGVVQLGFGQESSTNQKHQPMILLHLRVLEVAKTKLPDLGLEISEDAASQSLILNSDRFAEIWKKLRKDTAVKVLAEPTLVTVSNRTCSFHSGGSFAIPVTQPNGSVGIEFKRYGTSVDFVPIVTPDKNIHLECRVEVSQLDTKQQVTVAGIAIPGLRVQSMDTAVVLPLGRSLVLQSIKRVVTTTAGDATSEKSQEKPAEDQAPRESVEEIVTLFILTPELVEPMKSTPSPKS